MAELALYIHWPWCVSKCPYCDFNSHVLARHDSRDAAAAGWRDACLTELETWAALTRGRRIGSVFFGGGTPSLMPVVAAGALLDRIAALWPVAENAEITLEANPTSVEADSFAGFRAAGINRLSLGVQSFDDAALKFLGRAHDAAQARRAAALAVRHFERVSFDLITARHGQDWNAWEAEMREALGFGIRHLSLYQLTIEPGTPFAALAERRSLQLEEDAASFFFAETRAFLAAAGLPAYEISNHAAPEEESRHNLAYWTYGDYLGVGPGAHTRVTRPEGRAAFANIRDPAHWQQAAATQGRGLATEEALDAATAQREALMMGLRLTRGIARAVWSTRFGTTLEAALDPARRQRLQNEGLLVLDAEGLRATPDGLQRLDAVLRYLA